MSTTPVTDRAMAAACPFCRGQSWIAVAYQGEPWLVCHHCLASRQLVTPLSIGHLGVQPEVPEFAHLHEFSRRPVERHLDALAKLGSTEKPS